jgi:hypothetical protein
MVIVIISTAGMRVNISKSKFFAEKMEYLAYGYWITNKIPGIWILHHQTRYSTYT